MVISVILILLAIILFALGAMDRYTGNNRALPIAFFVLGFLHLLGAIFLFTGGVAPYGAVQTVNTTYQPGYFEYANDTVTCIDCGNCTNSTTCSGTFLGINWCEKFTDESTCEACDQCNWTGTECQPITDASCEASLTCEDCGCNSTTTSLTSTCCEHDVNTTVTGTITQEYAYNTYGSELMLAYLVVDGILFFFVVFIYLLSLLASYFRIITGKRRGEDDD